MPRLNCLSVVETVAAKYFYSLRCLRITSIQTELADSLRSVRIRMLRVVGIASPTDVHVSTGNSAQLIIRPVVANLIKNYSSLLS